MRLKLANIFFIILLSFNGLAQTPFLKQVKLFKGKEDYSVNIIFQDKKGLMWFGTDKGLFKFDGIIYTRYTAKDGLAEDNITAIYEDNSSKVWIGHKGGAISIYDGKEFKSFVPEETLGHVRITDIISDMKGIIWYSTYGEGLFRYDGRHLSNINTDDGLSDNNVYDLEIDKNNRIWMATDNGISMYSEGKTKVISMKDGLLDNIVMNLKFDEDGKLWIGTDEKGISVYDPTLGTFLNLNDWTYGTITGFTLSLENEIWVSTQKEGILQMKLSDENRVSYRQITVKQGLVSNNLNCIFKDIENNIWIGGKLGVIQALPPVFEFLDVNNGTPFTDALNFLIDNSGNYWVCSESGLYKGIQDNLGQLNWENISKRKSFSSINFVSLYSDITNQIWAGTYGSGVLRIDPRSMNYKKYDVSNGLSDNNVVSISGKDSLIWLSTLGGGVSCFNLSDNRIRNYDDPELKNSYIYSSICDKNGRTWLAGSPRIPVYIQNDIVYRFDKSDYNFPPLYGIAMDTSGHIWFNTSQHGIICLSDDSIKHFGKPEGIEFSEIQSIIFDKFNNLLIISNEGLAFYNPEKGFFLELGENTGLSYREPFLNSVYTDKQKQIWISTKTGIIKYNPEYLNIIEDKPKVILSTIDLLDSPIDRNKSRYSHRENNFSFGFTAIWFKNPEGVSFRYKLEGNDLNWIYTEKNQIIPASNLSPGKYIFKVEVSLDRKNWYASDDSNYSFSISPPFWKRWWFILTVILIILVSIYAYIRLRLSFLEKVKRELEDEVYKRTEEIRNQNEELETQKEEIASQRDHAESQRDQIEQQNQEIHASIRYAHRIQSAALPPKSQLDRLFEDYFILNKPRDIVSGDFYWVAANENHQFFAVADCTGHGVPGAFMSMLGLSALNDIVKSLKVCKASDILNLLRERISESLHQQLETEVSSSDGMDISICVYDPGTGTLQFAGAHNPLYIISNQELRVIPADKLEIGSYVMENQSFTNHSIQINQNDKLYLFSDGLPDQFGGPNGKKYKYLHFREFLLSIKDFPLHTQKLLLEEEIESWKANFPQIDDIMVLGVRLKHVG